MKSNLIHSTRRFNCTSYGNGLAYVLEQRSTGMSVLFQGDDAEHFRNELELLSNGRLPLGYDDVLGVLWNDYDTVATMPVEAPRALPAPARLQRVK